jgi:hypothetical protein
MKSVPRAPRSGKVFSADSILTFAVESVTQEISDNHPGGANDRSIGRGASRGQGSKKDDGAREG